MPSAATGQIFGPRIEAVPARALPPSLSTPIETRPVDPSQFRIPKSGPYRLDAGDVLGVFVDGVLGDLDSAPPVTYPEPENNLPPAMGFPTPVREDGTISLPLIEPIDVRGRSIIEAEELVTRAYRDPANPIIGDRSRVIVTHLRKRTVGVTVLRGDNSQASRAANRAGNTRAVSDRSDRSSRAQRLDLPAGDNDLLNALALTGGLPGVNAKADVKVYRGNRAIAGAANGQPQTTHAFPRSTGSSSRLGSRSGSPTVTQVPTRTTAGYRPHVDPNDARLNDGDIIVIESRETDFYYTGGLLGGGQFLLPRDYSLDVVQAVALAGGTNATAGRTGSGLSRLPASDLLVLRQRPGNRQIPIRVDLNAALNDPRQRIRVMPGDTLILRYSPRDNATNLGIGVLDIYGTRQLFGR